MTESLVRAFLLGALSAWLFGVLHRRLRLWLATRALDKILEKQGLGSLSDYASPGAKPQGPDVVAVKETDPWPENPPKRL